MQAKADRHFDWIAAWERPVTHQCCAAARWVRLRLAASSRARHAYYCQLIEQVGICGEAELLAGPANLRLPSCHVAGAALLPPLALCLSHGLVASPLQLQGTHIVPDASQVKEELVAAKERRPPVRLAEPALHLDLPAALQQPPPRLDMCSACARLIEQVGV